jgi:hypothetical protein
VTLAPHGSIAIEAGLHLQHLRVRGEDTSYNQQGEARRRTTFVESTARQGAYGLARIQLGPALTVSPGVHVDRFELVGETAASPWMQIELGLPGPG